MVFIGIPHSLGLDLDHSCNGIGGGSPVTAGGERISGSKSVVFIESVGAGTTHSLGLDLDHSCNGIGRGSLVLAK